MRRRYRVFENARAFFYSTKTATKGTYAPISVFFLYFLSCLLIAGDIRKKFWIILKHAYSYWISAFVIVS